MRIVSPKTLTTLLVTAGHEVQNFITARAAIRHLMSGKAKGIDAMGNVVSWSGTDLNLSENGSPTLRWFNNEVSLYEDQPALRSAPNPITGEERPWAIPTILVCTNHFYNRNRVNKAENVSLKTLYKVYKGTCVYCMEKIPFSQATRDHHWPKAQGGTNHDFNVVLACWDCNNRKGNIFPYLNAEGKEVKPIKINDARWFIASDVTFRKEWEPYFYK